jgi:uncharacterized protein VirK/YbjX
MDFPATFAAIALLATRLLMRDRASPELAPATLALPRTASSSHNPLVTPIRSPGPAGRPRQPGRIRFQDTDDGSGGRLETWRRRAKFTLRCWWHAGALRSSLQTFEPPALTPVLRADPTIALRPLRSYLRQGLGSSQRARALREHFGWMAAGLAASTVNRLYQDEALALVDADTLVPGLSITLGRSGGLGREGELALNLMWQGERVMSLAFSVLEADVVLGRHDPVLPHGARAVVGVLQGARGADAARRALSQACHRLQPTALLIGALQALGRAWGLQPPLCVASRAHVYAAYGSRRRRVGLDYDAIWQAAGGCPAGRSYWLLPPEPVLRPDSAVASQHRAAHRRRNALRAQADAQVQAAARALVQTASGARGSI